MATVPISEPVIVVDGSLDFSGGQDASSVPDRTSANAFYSGINVSTRNAVISPRYGRKQITLKFPEGGVTLPSLAVRPYSKIFEEGRFQAFIPYVIGIENFYIIVVSGVIFLVNTQTQAVSVISILGGSMLNELAPRINWSDAGRFLVLFDYPSYPVIIENGIARRADPALFEVPISVMGTYNQNRLFISNAGNEFTAGDPAGNLATPNAPVTFEEIEVPSAPYVGQSFQLTTNYGNSPITAMTFLQVNDVSTGIGPLLVATKDKIYSYQSQKPRAQWAPNGDASQFGAAFVINSGIAGPRAFTAVGSDIFFISGDGQLRSASMSRDEQGTWARVPISREVQNWLKYYDESLAYYSVLAYFDNHILVSVNPYYVVVKNVEGDPILDVVFAGFAVIETANISKLSNKSNPSWAGLWKGLRPMDVLVSGNSCFVMSKDFNSVNRLYQITTDTIDFTDDHELPITSTIYTRQYDFQDPFQLKELHSIELTVANIRGKFSVDVYYKPVQGSRFVLWKGFKHEAPYQTCKIPTPVNVNGLLAHNFMPIILGWPDKADTCAEVTKMLYRFFTKLELKFVITGRYWEIQEFKIKAVKIEQQPNQTWCAQYPVTEVAVDCSLDWAIEGIDLCQTQAV